MHEICGIVFGLLVLTTAAAGQVPKGNVFFGYSYQRADVLAPSGPGPVLSADSANLNGWDGSLEGKLLPWVGIVADISGHYGSRDSAVGCEALPPPCTPTSVHVSSSQYTFLFGPRVSVSVGKFTPFAHALFGAGHVSNSANLSGSSNSDTSFATAVGGGLDYKLFPAVGWRFQGDFVQTRFFSNTQNDFRFSTGVVLHF